MTLFSCDHWSERIGPIFGGTADFDLELIESRTFDGKIHELVYRPTLHRR